MVQPTVSFRVDSQSAIKGLDKYKGETLKKINQAIHERGFRVESEVKQSIAGRRAEPRSVDTGHMMQSVYTDASMYFVAYVYGGAEYTQYLENGTSRIAARNHFKNTLLREKQGIVDAVKQAVKE